MPSLSSRGVFLSFRLDDDHVLGPWVEMQLRERVPDARVFTSLDTIKMGGGRNLAEDILKAVDSCAVLVAFIGPAWKHQRLDDPDDYVRSEIQTAFEHGVQVIPVLIHGAQLPPPQKLPSALHKLDRLHALVVSDSREVHDVDQLLNIIERVL